MNRIPVRLSILTLTTALAALVLPGSAQAAPYCGITWGSTAKTSTAADTEMVNGIRAGLLTRTDPRLERPDLQINLLEWSTLERSGTRVVAHDFPGFTLGPVHLSPDGRGTVRLNGPDPLAPPAITFGFLGSDYDMRAMVAGATVAATTPPVDSSPARRGSATPPRRPRAEPSDARTAAVHGAGRVSSGATRVRG